MSRSDRIYPQDEKMVQQTKKHVTLQQKTEEQNLYGHLNRGEKVDKKNFLMQQDEQISFRRNVLPKMRALYERHSVYTFPGHS